MFNEIVNFLSATDWQNLWFFIQLGWNLQFYSMIIWQNSRFHSFFFPCHNCWSIKRKKKAKIHEKALSQIVCVMRSHWNTMKAQQSCQKLLLQIVSDTERIWYCQTTYDPYDFLVSISQQICADFWNSQKCFQNSGFLCFHGELSCLNVSNFLKEMGK